VTFAQAVACARFLGRRLLTADEWEAAASVDPGSPRDRLLYPWGASFRAEALGLKQPLDVGTASWDLSPAGCLDMGGNVSEWTVGEQGEAVLKGGSFLAREELLFRSFHRSRPKGVYKEADAGFRLARDVLPPDLAEFAK
jgi:formylglycine-generating enzyme required for sulfatase activity